MESSSSSAIEQYSTNELPALSDTQDYVLSIVPIPAALLSIFGSVCIVRMNFTGTSRKKKRTPYNRLLIAMSLCDIVYSITLAMSVFLMPHETSTRRWALGNDQTCSLTGFLMQFSNSTIIYNTMLSFYFLCIARFGISNERISKCIEPFMHILSIGYPLVTGLVGAVLGVYSEPELSNACWVNNYPESCGTVELDGPGASGEPCQSPKIAWAFAGAWYIIAFFGLVGNNVVICFHVWRQTRPKPSRPTETEVVVEGVNEDYESDLDSSSLYDLNVEEEEDRHHKTKKSNSPASSLERGAAVGASVAPLEIGDRVSRIDTQLGRLKLVRSQALLFVGIYMLSMIWTVTLRLVEAYAGTYEQKLAANNYTLLVLQAWFLPLQGFLNLFVYVRPKYVRRRQMNPEERLLDSMRVSVLGGQLQITEGAVNTSAPERQEQRASSKPNSNTKKTTSEDKKVKYFKRLKRSFISSITASQGDFIENIQEEEKWGTPQVLQEGIDAPQRCESNMGSSSLSAMESYGDITQSNLSSKEMVGSSSGFSLQGSSGDISKASYKMNRYSSKEIGSADLRESFGDMTPLTYRMNRFSSKEIGSPYLRDSFGDFNQSSFRNPKFFSKDVGSSGFSSLTFDSNGDITQSYPSALSSSNSLKDLKSPTMKTPMDRTPMDRMQSIAQRCQSGGHDFPLKFPQRQDSRHQRDGMMTEELTDHDDDNDNNNRWVSTESSGGDIPNSPRRSHSMSHHNVLQMEDLPAIEEVSEHNRKSSPSRTSNDTAALAAQQGHNRWQLPEPPLETSDFMDQPARHPSDDEDLSHAGSLVDSTKVNDNIPMTTKTTSITMTGVIAIVNELDVSDSSETNRPSVDSLHTHGSVQSRGSMDVALKVPIRLTSEADEMDSIS